MNVNINQIRPAAPHHIRSSLSWHDLAWARMTSRLRRIMTIDNVREFLLAFCACFLAVSLFLW